MTRHFFTPVAIVGLLSLLLGCEQPNFATDAEVLTILETPASPLDQAALVTRGRQLFVRHSCSNCHAVEGPEHGAPLLRNLYTTSALLKDGSQLARDRTYLVRSILHPQEQVVRGYAQPMSNYRFLPADEVAALVTYLESLTPPPTPSQPRP